MKMNASLLFLALSLFAGALIPFQNAMNSTLGRQLQSPYFSTFVVFAVGLIGMAIYILITRSPVPTIAQFSGAPYWSYFGGLTAGVYVLLLVICAPKVGIGNVTVMVLLGQILAAMIIDQWGLFGALIHAMNWQRFAGILLMIGGVYLVKKF